jgi:hypothetical protein
MRAVQVNAYLQDVLQRFADELESGALLSISEDALRLRRLPIAK